METILVLSDIHSAASFASSAVEKHPECKTVIFLGDGTKHLPTVHQHIPNAEIIAVCGNSDSPIDGVEETERTLEICGHRIFICHGHMHRVEAGLSGLLAAAKEKNADIALYGHTHIAHKEYDSENGVYMFNPGSLGSPRDGCFSYGLLSLDEKNVQFSVESIF